MKVQGTYFESVVFVYKSNLLIKINTNKNEIRFTTQLPF